MNCLEVKETIVQYMEDLLQEEEKNMTPRQAADVIFRSCAEKNWEEFAKFLPASGIRQYTKAVLGGLEVVSLGEPFQSDSGTSHFATTTMQKDLL
jgi:hypothetical protein